MAVILTEFAAPGSVAATSKSTNPSLQYDGLPGFQFSRIPPTSSPTGFRKSIIPWYLGHKKGPQMMQAYDFKKGKCGGP
jgi:hypothetical protein